MTSGPNLVHSIGSDADLNSDTSRSDSAEDALILQTEWEQADPLGVLELDSGQVFEDDELLLEQIVEDQPAHQAEYLIDDATYLDALENGPKRPVLGWVLGTLAGTAIVAWTGFFAFTHHQTMLAGAPLAQWTAWTSEWSIPVLLVAVAWMSGMRNSRSEAKRFANTAALLAREANDLEARLNVVNRELSLAREFLGAQTRELDSLGRIATDRISQHADSLQSLIQSNSSQLDSIASVSDTALSNMSKLRDDLPVIANSAKDVSNQVGNAGRTAEDQLGKLVSGFERLNEFGSASERQVSNFTNVVGATLESFEAHLKALEEATSAKFAALKDESTTFRTEMTENETLALAAMRERTDELRQGMVGLREAFSNEEEQAIAAMRSRISALMEEGEALAKSLRSAEAASLAALTQSKDQFYEQIAEAVGKLDALDEQAVGAAQKRVQALYSEASQFDERLKSRDLAFQEEVARRQEKLADDEAAAVEQMSRRLAELDETLSQRGRMQEERNAHLLQQGEEIIGKVAALQQLYDAVSRSAEGTQDKVSGALSGLQGRVHESEALLASTGKAVADLTDTSVRLLEIIQSSTNNARTDLPKAVNEAYSLLSKVEDRTVMLSATMETAAERGDKLALHVQTAQEEIAKTESALGALQQHMGVRAQEMLEKIDALQTALSNLDSDGEKLSAKTQSELSASIGTLETSIMSAFGAMESGAKARIGDVATNLGNDATQAIEMAMSEKIDEMIARLEERAEKATGASHEAAEHLRSQLDEVNELAGNLEQRVAYARERAQERSDSDLARRMAHVTESLNSNAIDISGSLSVEISDTAWDAYLKGDRGIFTRKAVKILSSGEAREIASLYQADDGFRGHVNRYIRDFEDMLRTMLATKDGNALSVTLLGSDIGKLYVALAQAIERIRH